MIRGLLEAPGSQHVFHSLQKARSTSRLVTSGELRQGRDGVAHDLHI